MVDVEGDAAEACACPLDPGFRAYFEELMRLFSQEDFRVIWVEDDIRLHNHGPLKWGGCFCPLHVAEFNRRNGLHATREEIVTACTAPGEPHPWRRLWFEMWDDTQRELITHWREIAEAAGVRLGLMSSAVEAHSAEGRDWEKWWAALSGDKPPIHRPSFWPYSDTVGSHLPHSIAMEQELRSLQPPGTECGPEIECFNYGRWHKSLRQTGAQMALAHVLGASNLNISLYDFLGNDPDDDPARADFLRRWRPVCDWLAKEFPMTMRSVGVGLPWSPEMGAQVRLPEGSQGHWESLECSHRDWVSWLGAFGQAFAMGAAPLVNALSGPVVRSFSDAQLKEWLSRGVLLDGPTAQYLYSRGLGDLLGLRDIHRVTQHEMMNAYEESRSEEFGLRPGRARRSNLLSALMQAVWAEGVRIVSDVYDPEGKRVGHGLALYENALGGRVAVYPWSTSDRLGRRGDDRATLCGIHQSALVAGSRPVAGPRRRRLLARPAVPDRRGAVARGGVERQPGRNSRVHRASARGDGPRDHGDADHRGRRIPNGHGRRDAGSPAASLGTVGASGPGLS